MKTLANCTPREFLVQSNKIRKSVANWLKLTNIMDIRKRLPELPDGISEEERRERVSEQIQANANAMLEAVLEKHPEETAELLGLMCFVEPDELDNHTMPEFLGAFSEMLECREIVDFFTSLMRLGSASGSKPAKK